MPFLIPIAAVIGVEALGAGAALGTALGIGATAGGILAGGLAGAAGGALEGVASGGNIGKDALFGGLGGAVGGGIGGLFSGADAGAGAADAAGGIGSDAVAAPAAAAATPATGIAGAGTSALSSTPGFASAAGAGADSAFSDPNVIFQAASGTDAASALGGSGQIASSLGETGTISNPAAALGSGGNTFASAVGGPGGLNALSTQAAPSSGFDLGNLNLGGSTGPANLSNVIGGSDLSAGPTIGTSAASPATGVAGTGGNFDNLVQDLGTPGATGSAQQAGVMGVPGGLGGTGAAPAVSTDTGGLTGLLKSLGVDTSGGPAGILKGNASTLLNVGGLAKDLIAGTPKIPNEGQLTGSASLLSQLGATNEAALNSGLLPPGADQAIQQAVQSEKARVRSQYAQMGLSGSTMEQQALGSVDANAAAQRLQLMQQLVTTGLNETNMADQIYAGLARQQMANDQALQSSIAGFASNLAGGPSITQLLKAAA